MTTTFFSAYRLLVSTAKQAVNSINEDPSNLVEFCKVINLAKKTKNRIHIVGMGRSGKVGMLFGEILKNIGLDVSYIGKSLAKPVRKGDIVVGFTGSGWTSFTCKAIEESIEKEARILVLTSNQHSKAARLADTVINILTPSGYSKTKKKEEAHAPLTPMGTVFEMNSLVVGMGIFSGLTDDFCVKGFNEGVNEVLRSAEATYVNLQKNQNRLDQFIDTIGEYPNNPHKKLYVFGSGLDSIISTIASIRFSHLRINVKSDYDWRFRENKDLFIAISGSGQSTTTLEHVQSAKATNMKILGLTSFSNSKLALESNFFLEIEGRTEETNVYLQKISDLSFFVPSFEYVSAITLDSCVAQLAEDSGISEIEMKAEHANIE